MPRAALILASLAGLLAASAPLEAQPSQDPHLDGRLIPGGCRACHKGHGEPSSPMLPGAQAGICLDCHGETASLSELARNGSLAADVRPQSLAATLAQPFVHPISPEAYSARQEDLVTCTSCHSPHRGNRAARDRARSGEDFRSKRLSPKNPLQFEYELCESCHGNAGVLTQDLLDLSRLLSPQNRSFHPVEAEATERSPSIKPELEMKFVSCTDCHGNSDPAGPAGPHGSEYPYLVRLEYVTADGTPESESSYALCYDCHERELVLDSPRFPLHRLHVVREKTSCSTCHNAHGSVENRALIRFSEEIYLAGVSPSAAAERLAFDSMGPGSGSCYVLCHGVDHAPLTYGPAASTFRNALGAPVASPAETGVESRSARPLRPPTRLRPERQSPPPR